MTPSRWYDFDYKKWISDGCDLNSASKVLHLSLYCCRYEFNLHAGLFKHFVNLQIFNLSFCNLNTIPEDVWELTQLTELYIHNNNICEISPKIKNLTNLKIFQCDGNILTAFPVEMCQLTKLFEFEFYDNKLDVLDQKVVDFITQIKYYTNQTR